MNRQPSLKPILSIDLRKNRIRIHKQTLHMMGDPEYIQLLVNPETQIIAIKKSIREDFLAHKVSKEQLASKNCYELYSKILVMQLCKVNTDWDRNETYRIYGELLPEQGLASFNMTETIQMNK